MSFKNTEILIMFRPFELKCWTIITCAIFFVCVIMNELV